MSGPVFSSKIEASLTPSQEYLKGLLWHMHHSYAPGRRTYTLANYLDDSGSDDLSPVTAIGGTVMSAEAFVDFGAEWGKMLVRNRIDPPLHMSDFTGSGKYASMLPEMKLALFIEVESIIRMNRLYSISVTVPRDGFNQHLSDDVRRGLISPYAFAFFTTVLANQGFSDISDLFYAEPIAYLIDAGYSYAEQLMAAHAAIRKTYQRRGESCFVGSMTQDTDDRVAALQAADVISYCARRRTLGTFTGHLVPLGNLFNRRHAHIELTAPVIKLLADPINNWINKNGQMPSLSDVLR